MSKSSRNLRILCFFLFAVIQASLVYSAEIPYGEPEQDVYYQTPGIPQGPAAEKMGEGYPQWGMVDNRILTWGVTQQHTYFGGFVLALPLFAFLLEFFALQVSVQN